MKRNYEQLIMAGNKAQIEKLKMNEHKKGFDKLTFSYVFKRLVDEVIELKKAFEAEDVNKQGIKNIRHEFADVANFSHMGILLCDQELIK